MDTWRKTDPHPSRISHEACSLAWLADSGPGSAPVVRVLGVGDTWIEEERLVRSSPTAVAAEDFGRTLARTHAAGAPHLGCPPPGHEGDGWMGLAPLPLLSQSATSSWGAFYAEYRLAPYLECAAFSAADRALFTRLLDRLASGDFDHRQPALVEEGGAGAARTHGDLWSGNVMWTPAGAVLIDPAGQGGHAEEDLAQLDVFGCPYGGRIRAAYDEASPLADGWKERIGLHQLHILTIHASLFGASYTPDVMRIVRRFVDR